MERKREIYNFIRQEVACSGRPPTIREIGLRFNISSTNGVRYFLDKLEAEGLIKRISKTARGISLAGSDYQGGAKSVAVLGRVPAGGPDYGEEHIEGHILVDDRIAGGGDLFAVRVHGDSMIGAGINDGDIAVVKKNPEPLSGDIVIALIDDDVTLKRLIKKGSKVILRPENDRYQDIVLSDMGDRNISILGTLEAIVRNYR
jgi:repressor LexA